MKCIKKITMTALSVSTLMFLVSGCGAEAAETDLSKADTADRSIVAPTSEMEDAVEIIFNKTFLRLSGVDEEGLIDVFAQWNSEEYISLTANGDESVTGLFTPEQIEYWKGFADEKYAEANAEFGKDHEGNSVEVSGDTITVYTDQTADFTKEMMSVGRLPIYCEMRQLFEGVTEPTVNLYVYNAETKKPVAGGNLYEGSVDYGNEEWAQSYTLTEEEAKEVYGDMADASLYYPTSNSVDNLSIITLLCQAGGYDRLALYMNEDDQVVLGLTDAQKETMLSNIKAYTENLKTEFTLSGNNYRLEINEDYTDIRMDFDSELPEQNQVIRLAYAQTACMLINTLNGNDSVIHMHINNSATGEHVADGDSVNGITWKISDGAEYIIGTYTCGGFGTMFDAFVYDEYIVTKDARLLVMIKSGDRDYFDMEDITVIDKEIPQETFDKINEILRKTDLRKLRIKEAGDVLDGYSKYLVLYDENGDREEIGGYMPKNKTFSELSGLIRSICSEEDEEAIGQARELAEQTCNQEKPK